MALFRALLHSFRSRARFSTVFSIREFVGYNVSPRFSIPSNILLTLSTREPTSLSDRLIALVE
jgi:hypothetical protein